VTGGLAATICPADNPYGLSWDNDGLVFGQGTGQRGIHRVSQNGGASQLVVPIGEAEIADAPQLLPGGAAMLFTLAATGSGEQWDRGKVVVQSLKSGERTMLVDGASGARYVSTGHLLYAIGGTLFAIAFRWPSAETTGTPRGRRTANASRFSPTVKAISESSRRPLMAAAARNA
jgi:hypothetical protein